MLYVYHIEFNTPDRKKANVYEVPKVDIYGLFPFIVFKR